MNLTWKEYPDAPDPGQALGAEVDVATGKATFVEIGGFPILLVRAQNGPRAFVNACPHQFLPLNMRSDQVISASGKGLICSNHHAVFSIETGLGISGEGIGTCLAEIPISVANGQIFIAKEA